MHPRRHGPGFVLALLLGTGLAWATSPAEEAQALRAAGQRAMHHGYLRTADRALRKGIQALDRSKSPDTKVRGELRLAQGDLLRLAGKPARARKAYRAAAQDGVGRRTSGTKAYATAPRPGASGDEDAELLERYRAWFQGLDARPRGGIGPQRFDSETERFRENKATADLKTDAKTLGSAALQIIRNPRFQPNLSMAVARRTESRLRKLLVGAKDSIDLVDRFLNGPAGRVARKGIAGAVFAGTQVRLDTAEAWRMTSIFLGLVYFQEVVRVSHENPTLSATAVAREAAGNTLTSEVFASVLMAGLGTTIGEKIGYAGLLRAANRIQRDRAFLACITEVRSGVLGALKGGIVGAAPGLGALLGGVAVGTLEVQRADDDYRKVLVEKGAVLEGAAPRASGAEVGQAFDSYLARGWIESILTVLDPKRTDYTGVLVEGGAGFVAGTVATYLSGGNPHAGAVASWLAAKAAQEGLKGFRAGKSPQEWVRDELLPKLEEGTLPEARDPADWPDWQDPPSAEELGGGGRSRARSKVQFIAPRLVARLAKSQMDEVETVHKLGTEHLKDFSAALKGLESHIMDVATAMVFSEIDHGQLAGVMQRVRTDRIAENGLTGGRRITSIQRESAALLSPARFGEWTQEARAEHLIHEFDHRSPGGGPRLLNGKFGAVRSTLEALRAQQGAGAPAFDHYERIEQRLELFLADVRGQILNLIPGSGAGGGELTIEDPTTFPATEPATFGDSQSYLVGLWREAHRCIAIAQALHVSAQRTEKRLAYATARTMAKSGADALPPAFHKALFLYQEVLRGRAASFEAATAAALQAEVELPNRMNARFLMHAALTKVSMWTGRLQAEAGVPPEQVLGMGTLLSPHGALTELDALPPPSQGALPARIFGVP